MKRDRRRQRAIEQAFGPDPLDDPKEQRFRHCPRF
jgi:hypothetical protein